MKLRETWQRQEPSGIRRCVWCLREASMCVIENPCEDRKKYEEVGACSA
jgi:hypothetical protein